MKGSAGILLVAVGLIALYIVLSDKYQCVTGFVGCMTGQDFKTPEGYTKSDNAQPSQEPQSSGWNWLPKLPVLAPMIP